MAVTAQGSGTKTVATVGVAETLLDVAVSGTFTLHINTLNMVAGDVLEIRIYQIILTADAREVAYWAKWSGAQPADDRIKISVPISNELTDAGALRFEINQTKGAAARAFKWKVLKYA